MSVARTTNRRRGVTREAILDTARRLFSTEGYRGTTLEAVAAELGVTRAALYHWVPSKESLLCEIHDRAMDLLVERFEKIQESDLRPVEKLGEALRAHTLVVADNLETIAVFFKDVGSLPEEDAKRIASRKRRYDRQLESIVKAGQADGSIRSDLHPRVLVESVVAMCNWIYNWYNPRGPVKPEQLADQVVAIALNGITAR